jgi:surface antigen
MTTVRSSFRLSGFTRSRYRLPLAVMFAAALGLGACANRDAGRKQTGGAVVGAVAGGVAGSMIGKGSGRLIMTGLGTLLGAYIGSQVGKSLDNADRAAAANTAQQTFENNKTGQPGTWNNPDNGHTGTITPTKTYQQADGAYCREYQQTVTVGGKTEQAYGTACRQPDGSWKIVN